HDRRDSELCQGDFPMKPKNPFNLEGAGPLPEKALEALDHVEPSRRDFLKTAGVMMIGFGVAAATAPPVEAQSPINPSGNAHAHPVQERRHSQSGPHRWQLVYSHAVRHRRPTGRS